MKLARSEFEKLALEQVDMLYRLARRLTRDPARAEDLLQDTFVRALSASEGFELQEYGIRPWLIRIMRNVHFSRAQRDKRAPAAIAGEVLESASATEGESSASSTALAADGTIDLKRINVQDMDERLVAAVEQLPADYQVVLLLWAVDELSYKEIADACEVPIGTVMSRLHRARQKLGEILAEFAREQRLVRE